MVWGATARDSFTIPSFTAAILRTRGVTDVELVNLGQAAFNTTQEAATLMLELARGRPPDAVVFLNGYNDIATAVRFGAAGHTYGEEGIERSIELGGRGFWAELVGLGRHARLIERLSRMVRPEPARATVPTERMCRDVGRYFH